MSITMPHQSSLGADVDPTERTQERTVVRTVSSTIWLTVSLTIAMIMMGLVGSHLLDGLSALVAATV